jgi:glutamate-1-semialdehyde 2,1-aminomutase
MTDWTTRALAVSPGGSQTRSKAPGRVGPRDCREGFPLFATRGNGPYLYARHGDTGEEDRYLDFAGANAAVPLGYGHEEVARAVERAAYDGHLLSLPSEQEVEVSELFCQTVGAEQVRWLKTGSESLSAAVRIARAATGASAVLVGCHSYHGWHDFTLARFDNHGLAPGSHCFANGVPSVLGPTVLEYAYDKTGAAKDAVIQAHRRGQRVAAVLVEPHRFLPDQGWMMQQAREAADDAGAVLIFDEMVYGFRWAKGGGTEYFGGHPDLRCYGKALGNGVPVACVCGPTRLMRYAEQAFVSGTYGGDRLGLAAAGAVLKIHAREDVIGQLWQNGQVFWDTLASAVPDRRFDWRLVGFPVHFGIKWASSDEADRVLTACARRGVLFHRDACNASAVMTKAQVVEGATVLAETLAGTPVERP